MTSPNIFEFNIKNEIDRLFDDSSKASTEPVAVILMGGIATGKTTLRKQKYSRGHVLIDAGDIFLNLSRGEFLPFPGPLESAMEVVGRAATKRALSERRHIVTEIIGANQQATEQLADSLAQSGYKIEFALLSCAPEEAAKRNAARNIDESISAHFSEPFQRTWLIEAAAELAAEALTVLEQHVSDDAYLKTQLFENVPDLASADNLVLLNQIEQLARQCPRNSDATHLHGLLRRMRDIGFEHVQRLEYDEANFVLRMAILAMRRVLQYHPEFLRWVADILTTNVADYVRNPMAMEGCSSRAFHVNLMDAIHRLYAESAEVPFSAELSEWHEQWKKYLDPEFWNAYYARYGC